MERVRPRKFFEIMFAISMKKFAILVYSYKVSLWHVQNSNC